MVNLFQGQTTQSDIFGKLYYNPKLQVRINKFFSLLGFKKLVNSHGEEIHYDGDLYEDELTIYVYSWVTGVREDNLTENKNRGYLKDKIGNVGVDGCYCWIIEDAEKLYAFDDNDVVLGYYFKDRNVFLIPFDFFHACYGDSEKYYTKLMEIIGKSIIKSGMNFVKQDIGNIKTKILLKMLKTHLSQKISGLNYAITECEKNILNYRKNMLDVYNNRMLAKADLVNLIKISENYDQEIIKNIEEIRKLPFVDSVELTEDGIKTHLGKVSFTYKVGDENIKCYLGDYTMLIKGDKVDIKNKDYLSVGSSKVEHMHIRDNHICFGEWEEKILDLMHQFKYKELTFLIYTYIKSYNHNDCHVKFEEFAKFRKAEKKFDESGNLLKDKQEKQEVL